MQSGQPPDPRLLTAQGEFLRRLALQLVRDAGDADDAVQETWVAALRSPPDPKRPPRPWLAQVLRNVVAGGRRTAARRRAREGTAAQAPSEAPESADAVLERMRLHRLLSELLLSLEEPYRTTIHKRFFEGQEPSALAARLGIPAGTVRWRINEGLRRLRARLDEAHGGREAWRALLLPPRTGRPERLEPGVALRDANARWPTFLAGLLGASAVAGGAALLLPADPARPLATAPKPEIVLSDGATPRSAASGMPTPNKENAEMNHQNRRRAAAFFGLVLPTLFATASEGNATLTRSESVHACVRNREMSYECREPFIDAMMDLRLRKAGKTITPEERAKMRQVGLREIAEDGSGPLEPRKVKCEAMLDKMGSGAGIPRAVHEQLEACYARTDCQARIDCMMPIMERLMFRKR
jgi:RNA polymerase sigma factor (sigma-70 family)